MSMKASQAILVLSIILLFCIPVQAYNSPDIPGTYAVTSEIPATFVVAFVEDHKTGSNMTVTMIRENSDGTVSESPPLAFYYDNVKGEAYHLQQVGDKLFDDWMYIKFDFSGYAMRGEGYMRWGEKGEEKIPFTMVRTDGEANKKWPSAGLIEVPRDEKGNPIDCGHRISDISGEVRIRPGDDVLAWGMAELDMTLYHGDVMRLERGAEVHFITNDLVPFVIRGPAEIIVSLGPGEEENKLLLLAGKVIRNVKTMVMDGTLELEMSQGVAGIKGTTFVLEEDGTTSILKVLEGTVSFKPTNGEELILTDGQMVSATNGIAGKMIDFSIDEELSGWSEKTRLIFGQILEEAGHVSELKQDSQIVDTKKRNLSSLFVIMFGIVIVLIAGVMTGLIVSRKKNSKRQSAVADGMGLQSPQNLLPRFCSHCGSQISSENVFCGTCGRRIQ